MRNLIHSFFRLLQHPLVKDKKAVFVLKLFWWKLNQFVIRQPVLVPLIGKIKCICYPESSYGSLIFYCRWPEYDEMDFVLRILKTNSVFVDVGAGIGDYSLLAAHIIKKGRIFAFEPGDASLRQFQENLALNGLDRITVSSEVLSDREGVISFVESNTVEVSHIGLEPDKNARYSSTTLDKVVACENIDFIDVLKVDVEGAESLVLKGAKKSLSQAKIKVIILELNAHSTEYRSSHESILRTLRGHSYKIYTPNSGKLLPLDNLVQDETRNVVCIHDLYFAQVEQRYQKNRY